MAIGEYLTNCFKPVKSVEAEAILAQALINLMTTLNRKARRLAEGAQFMM